MTQKGYLIVEARVSDPAAYEIYKNLAEAAIAQYGGRYLVRGGAVETLEGDWTPKRTVILEFPDMDSLKAFWNAPEYQPLRAIRQKASTGRLVAIHGYQ